MTENLKQQYAHLCQKLGDATYRLNLLQSEISELQEQLKAVNVLNASLIAYESAKAQTLQDFIKNREQSGAKVELTDKSPV